MFETAFLFLVAFVLVILALDMLVINMNRTTLVAALWLGLLAVYVLLDGVKLYLIQANDMLFLGWAQRLQDGFWVHLGWVAWLFLLFFLHEEKEFSFPKRVIVMFGLSMVLSVIALQGGLYDSLSLYPMMVHQKLQMGILLTPSTIRILAGVYLFLLFGVGVGTLVAKYFSVQYTFQQRRIRYLLAGAFVSFFLFIFGEKRFVFLSLRALSFLILGVTIFYVASNFRSLRIREKVWRFMSLFLFGLFLMSVPAVILYIFREWLIRLSTEMFILIFSLGMSLYFVFSVLFLRFFQKLFPWKQKDEELFTLFLRLLGKKQNLYEFSQELTFLLKDLFRRECDIIGRQNEHFLVVFSTRQKEGIVVLHPRLIQHLESGEVYFDREMVLNQRIFRRDAGLFFDYFDTYELEALLPVIVEERLMFLIHFGEGMESEGFTVQQVRQLKFLLRVIEVLYQNVLFFEKEKENEQTQRELTLASDIQEALFQRDVPVVVGLDIAFYQEPAKWLSGDYLWLEAMSSHELGFVVADVSGKGISAALITMMIHSTVQGYQFASSTVSALLERLNILLSQRGSRGELKTLSFATVCVGFLDTQIQTLYYSNAGHYPLLVWDRELREFRELSTPGKPVGLFPEIRYETHTYRYEKDQILVVYSDGIIECIRSDETEFGVQRLKRLIQQYDHLSAEKMREKILEEIRLFTSGADIYDDMTLLILKT